MFLWCVTQLVFLLRHLSLTPEFRSYRNYDKHTDRDTAKLHDPRILTEGVHDHLYKIIAGRRKVSFYNEERREANKSVRALTMDSVVQEQVRHGRFCTSTLRTIQKS